MTAVHAIDRPGRRTISDALISPDFVLSKGVLLVPDAMRLRGFKHGMNARDLLRPDCLKRILSGHTGEVTLRRHADETFKVSLHYM